MKRSRGYIIVLCRSERRAKFFSRPGLQVQILDKYHTDIMHSRLRPMYIATCPSEPKGRPLSSGAPLLTPWLHSGPCPEHKGSGQDPATKSDEF